MKGQATNKTRQNSQSIGHFNPLYADNTKPNHPHAPRYSSTNADQHHQTPESSGEHLPGNGVLARDTDQRHVDPGPYSIQSLPQYPEKHTTAQSPHDQADR